MRPSTLPSYVPSVVPSIDASVVPSLEPSNIPSSFPTEFPDAFADIFIESAVDLCDDSEQSGSLSFQVQSLIEEKVLDFIQNETDFSELGVVWERATIYNFEEGSNCPGSNTLMFNGDGNSKLSLSIRGTCGGVCPNQTLPGTLNQNGRRLQLGYFEIISGVESYITFDVVGTSTVDCSLPHNCFDPVASKCCGEPGCSCSLVSVTECQTKNCDIMGGGCCNSRFADICGDSLACSCFSKNCGMIECCEGQGLEICKNETTIGEGSNAELLYPCQCYKGNCHEESCCVGDAAGICGSNVVCQVTNISSTPSSEPTMKPSFLPTKKQSEFPSKTPSLSNNPSNKPTNIPTKYPSEKPTSSPTECDGNELEIKITFDQYPDETSWILQQDSNIIKQVSKNEYSNDLRYSQIHDRVCLVNGVEYTWTIFDSAKDGICCSFGQGSYELEMNGVILGFGDEFGSSQAHKLISNENPKHWIQLGSDIDGAVKYGHFGISVSSSSDGSIIAVGAEGRLVGSSEIGRASCRERVC